MKNPDYKVRFSDPAERFGVS